MNLRKIDRSKLPKEALQTVDEFLRIKKMVLDTNIIALLLIIAVLCTLKYPGIGNDPFIHFYIIALLCIAGILLGCANCAYFYVRYEVTKYIKFLLTK